MIISVRNKDLRRQVFKTSCWISAAHFVLQYVDVDVSLATLHGRYYQPDKSSVFMMSGAGHPKKILAEYAFDVGKVPATLKPHDTEKEDVVAMIADSIRDNIPVIASIRTKQVLGFGHALVITAVNPENGTIAFKDPGTGTTPRPFGVDVRTVTYEAFMNGFSYRYAASMRQNIFTYCAELTYLRPMVLAGLFDDL